MAPRDRDKTSKAIIESAPVATHKAYMRALAAGRTVHIAREGYLFKVYRENGKTVEEKIRELPKDEVVEHSVIELKS